MKSIRLTLSIFAATLGALVASAQQAPAGAVLTTVVGDVTVTVPGSTVATPAVAGQKLAEGATVITSGGSIAIVKSHAGIETGLGSATTAVIGAHSVNAAGVRTANIDLKQGTSVSVLDPSKRAVNNYSVKTPKGVAAARGTTYATTVKINGSDVAITVNTVTGLVNFAIDGGASFDVAAGNSGNSASSTSISLADAMTADRETTAASLMESITVVALLASKAPDLAALLEEVIRVAVAAGLTQAEVDIAKDITGLTIQEAAASPGGDNPGPGTAPESVINITISPSS